MARPKQRTPQLRDRVLATAVDVLSHDGVSGFTTRRVAERAGTSVPAVYELFTDKAGLVEAVYFEGFRRLGRALAQVPETDSPLTDLEQLIPVFRRFCLDHPALARVMFSRPSRTSTPPRPISASASRRCAMSCWPRCAGASRPARCEAIPSTSRTSCWRSRRAWPSRRADAGSAVPRSLSTGDGGWGAGTAAGFAPQLRCP